MRGDNSETAADASAIPDKLYFRIGEVSRVTGVEPHVLRYWETEFATISPRKSGTGHRLYRRKDVELILEIKRLLYEERYTIEGARKHLRRRPKRAASEPPKRTRQTELFDSTSDALAAVKKELEDLLQILSP